ncbi:hypothetical protein MHUMG1_07026 [Metarhizium humberi]|uniref:AT hook, DNA-binding motif protein n=1 Tax=Metarhizium humberi TaxID=2596975 RepID=A0A9P8S556_9HYPO|nr:hypothetical protein MHUMG1_07026 [Metarhizium humberi]
MARTREEATSASADVPARRSSRASADGVSKPEPSGRGRGRPRSNKPPREPTGRPRGRPRLNKPPKEPTGRPRGRPKGSGKKAAEKKTPTKTTATRAGSRGRPRKLVGGEAAAIAKTSTPKAKNGRGRSRKSGDATLVAEVETVEEAKHAAEELEAAGEEGMDVDTPDADIRGDVEDVDDSEDAEGDDALDSPSGIASSPGEETGQQWISKIKGYFA